MNQANQIDEKKDENPQALRKAEIARLLKSVSNAPFNSEKKSGSNSRPFEKRSLLDIALNSSQTEANEIVETNDEQISDNQVTEDIPQEISAEFPQEINLDNSKPLDLSEPNLTEVIEEGPSIEEKIKIAEDEAFEKGRQQGLIEGHSNGLSEARAQAQEGLDAAIASLRSASDAINNSDDKILNSLQKSIEQAILGIAKECSGFIIDKVPEEFMERVISLSKVINKNISEITLDMNEQDFDAIKIHIEKDEVLSSLNIRVMKNLSRGDMVLSSDGMRISDIFSASKINAPNNDLVSEEMLNKDTLVTADLNTEIENKNTNNLDNENEEIYEKLSENNANEATLSEEKISENINPPLSPENKEAIQPEDVQNKVLETNKEILSEKTFPTEEEK